MRRRKLDSCLRCYFRIPLLSSSRGESKNKDKSFNDDTLNRVLFMNHCEQKKTDQNFCTPIVWFVRREARFDCIGKWSRRSYTHTHTHTNTNTNTNIHTYTRHTIHPKQDFFEIKSMSENDIPPWAGFAATPGLGASTGDAKGGSNVDAGTRNHFPLRMRASHLSPAHHTFLY